MTVKTQSPPLGPVLLVPLLLAGCLKDPSDNTPEDTGETQELAGTLGTLDCTDWYIDVWSVELEEGDELLAQVDTVSDATSFDPVLLITWEQSLPFADYELWMTDNMECSFTPPPEEAQCPEVDWTSNAAGTLHMVVDVASEPCAAETVEYRLTVEVNGESVTPVLVWDEYLDDF